ncbi:MAG: hypothetical protein JRH10_05170 [Deltaproteobacteria bacterium]|nr:hypothetical protein [Deltaproteobacteria bacterium]MBW2446590.1 hypothetical protein [Deltaproteobacteria bacterium]
MRRILALAAACTLVAGSALADSHEGVAGMNDVPEHQIDTAFVCGTALDSQAHYADNLITWLQGRCQDGFIGADVCKEINHYVTAYNAQVKEQAGACRERVSAK